MRMKNLNFSTKKIFFLIFFISVSALTWAAGASLADDLIKFLIKSKKYTKNYSKEFVERSIRKYGDDFIKLSKRYGDDVFEITQKHGDDGLKFINKYGDDGIKSLSNYGDDTFRFASKYGDDIVKILGKYDGVALRHLEAHGDDIIRLNKKLPREHMIAIFEASKKSSSQKVASRLFEKGDKAILYIEKHPKVFRNIVLTTALYQIVSNEELWAKVIDESGEIADSALTNITDSAKDTFIGLIGGSGSTASIIRAIILSTGILLILYSRTPKAKNPKIKRQDENLNKEEKNV